MSRVKAFSLMEIIVALSIFGVVTAIIFFAISRINQVNTSKKKLLSDIGGVYQLHYLMKNDFGKKQNWEHFSSEDQLTLIKDSTSYQFNSKSCTRIFQSDTLIFEAEEISFYPSLDSSSKKINSISINFKLNEITFPNTFELNKISNTNASLMKWE